VFDLDAAGNRFYPEAGSLASGYAVTPQFGFLYQHSPAMSVGASLTLPQNFTKYEWNSTIANPGLPEYGTARTLDFDLDGPMIVSFGTAIRRAKTQVAIDGMFTKYEGVAGFGSPGGIIDGVVYPFGWRNVWTIKAGVQHQATEKLAVRGGYNYSNMPLRDEVVLTMTGAPATFQHHYTGGVGIRMFPFLEAEAAFYYVPRDHVRGPLPNLAGEVIGTLDGLQADVRRHRREVPVHRDHRIARRANGAREGARADGASGDGAAAARRRGEAGSRSLTRQARHAARADAPGR
jgi:opacity protein-like surface antigen